VKVQKPDAFSMLDFYKRLIELRRQEPALHIRNYLSVFSDKHVIAMCYVREAGSDRFLIALNMAQRPKFFHPEAYPFEGTHCSFDRT
jgi:alpha-glucosidase